MAKVKKDRTLDSPRFFFVFTKSELLGGREVIGQHKKSNVFNTDLLVVIISLTVNTDTAVHTVTMDSRACGEQLTVSAS